MTAPSDLVTPGADLISVNPAYKREPLRFFRARNTGDGVAASFHLRLDPTYNPRGYVEDVGGGFFVEIAKQLPGTTMQTAKFDWANNETICRAKLGMVDLTKLAVSIRDFRGRGLEVPTFARARTRQGAPPADPLTVALFHQTGGAGAGQGNVAINYTFADETATIALSRNDGRKGRITIDTADEYALARYIDAAIDAFSDLGVR